MTRNEAVETLNKIYNRIEQLSEEAVNDMPKVSQKLANDLGDIIQDIEDNGLTEDEPLGDD